MGHAKSLVCSARALGSMRKISAGGQHDQINYLRLARLPPGEGIERRGEETVGSRDKNTNSDETGWATGQ